MTQGTDTLSQWESAALTAWGRYLTQAEERVIRQATAGRPGSVLDFGCGEGRWTHLLAGFGWRAICADTDGVALGKCRLRNPEAACVLLSRDNCTLPVADGSMDLILCVEVPGVLESGWFQKETSRVLKTGGMLLGVFHNRDYICEYGGHVGLFCAIASNRGRKRTVAWARDGDIGR